MDFPIFSASNPWDFPAARSVFGTCVGFEERGAASGLRGAVESPRCGEVAQYISGGMYLSDLSTMITMCFFFPIEIAEYTESHDRT